MSSRKSKTFPVIITFIFIVIIVYLFANLKQSQVTCEKTKSFDQDIRIKEELVAGTDGKKVNSINLKKTIILPEKYADQTHFNSIKFALEKTLDYLGDNVKYSFNDNKIIIKINVNKNEIVLLDNIEFFVNNDLQIKINSNTKSSEIIALSVGDNYTDGELMKHFKNRGYTCK
ncbi:MAG: hypothetical protein IKF37_03000 [Bacilli bacterium]|nr:hypothetical protein [Bacilli bacterium]